LLSRTPPTHHVQRDRGPGSRAGRQHRDHGARRGALAGFWDGFQARLLGCWIHAAAAHMARRMYRPPCMAHASVHSMACPPIDSLLPALLWRLANAGGEARQREFLVPSTSPIMSSINQPQHLPAPPPTPQVVKHGSVTCIGYTDMPSRLPAQSSTLYSNNISKVGPGWVRPGGAGLGAAGD